MIPNGETLIMIPNGETLVMLPRVAAPTGRFVGHRAFTALTSFFVFPFNNSPYKTLNMPMRMHEKVLNVLYGKLLNGKTKNEVNAMKARCRTKRPVGAAALGLKVARLFENTSVGGTNQL